MGRLGTDAIRELLMHFKHDKSNGKKKLEHLAAALDDYKKLEVVQKKVHVAMERLTQQVFNAVEDDEGRFDVKAFANKLETLVGIREDRLNRMQVG